MFSRYCCPADSLIAEPEAPKRQATATRVAPKDKKIAKLLVKNLAFEATKKDLQELFGAFGQVCGVELGVTSCCFCCIPW